MTGLLGSQLRCYGELLGDVLSLVITMVYYDSFMKQTSLLDDDKFNNLIDEQVLMHREQIINIHTLILKVWTKYKVTRVNLRSNVIIR